MKDGWCYTSFKGWLILPSFDKHMFQSWTVKSRLIELVYVLSVGTISRQFHLN